MRLRATDYVNLKKLLLYFCIPLLVTLPLVGMYFSGIRVLQFIVSPYHTGMNPSSSREFGLLENIQNIVLIAIIIIAFTGFRRKRLRWDKAAFGFITAFGVFVLLEELDYGLHIYEYVRGIPWSDSSTFRNVHNIGETTQLAKQVVDTGMVVLFVIAPLALARSKKPLVRYLTPDRYSVLTMLAALIVRFVAHALKDHGFGTWGTMHSNLSEFRELITYYVFMLYLVEVALLRNLDLMKSPAPTDPSNNLPRIPKSTE